jgi:hypothetical protein
LVLLNIYVYVEISSASAFAASITFTGKANLHSALDSSRYVYCNMPGYAIFTTTTAI